MTVRFTRRYHVCDGEEITTAEGVLSWDSAKAKMKQTVEACGCGGAHIWKKFACIMLHLSIRALTSTRAPAPIICRSVVACASYLGASPGAIFSGARAAHGVNTSALCEIVSVQPEGQI